MATTKKAASNYTLRLPAPLRKIIAKIAEDEHRSLHAQIMVFVEDGVRRAKGGA